MTADGMTGAATTDARGPCRIIVLGMHRSGTSVLANLVRSWGAYAAERALVPADRFNQAGYWEYEPLVQFNQALLRAVESEEMLPPLDEQAETLTALSASGDYRERALGLIAAMDAGGSCWVWKDPRLAVLLPFWQPLWGRAIYVVAVRHPCEVARSLHEREFLPLSAGLLVWQRHVGEILARTAGASRLFVSYERLLADPPSQCARLCRFLRAATGTIAAAADPREQIERMASAIDPAIRHQRPLADDTARAFVTCGQQQLAARLERLAAADAGAATEPGATAESHESRQAAASGVQEELFAGWHEYLLAVRLLVRWCDGDVTRRQTLLSTMPARYRAIYGIA